MNTKSDQILHDRLANCKAIKGYNLVKDFSISKAQNFLRWKSNQNWINNQLIYSFTIWKYLASKPAKKNSLIHSSPKVLDQGHFLVENLHQKLVVQIFLDIISLCSFPCLIIFRSYDIHAGMVFVCYASILHIYWQQMLYWWSCFILHLLHLC